MPLTSPVCRQEGEGDSDDEEDEEDEEDDSKHDEL